MSKYYHEIVTVDSLVEENLSALPEVSTEIHYQNLNYGMRTVLHYLIKYYDKNPDIAYASDHLARLIAQVESEVI